MPLASGWRFVSHQIIWEVQARFAGDRENLPRFGVVVLWESTKSSAKSLDTFSHDASPETPAKTINILYQGFLATFL